MADFTGDSGNNVLNGTSGDDVIFGGGGMDQLLGGDGNDRLVLDAPITPGGVFNGGNGIDTLELRNWATASASPNGPLTVVNLFGNTLTSIERLDFASQAGSSMTAQMLLSQATSSGLNQVTGGAGVDTLVLIALNGGTYTMPTLTRVNWSAPTISTPGDIVVLVASGPQNFTLNASLGHSGVEGLIGGAGNDVLNGSDGSEFLNGGGGVNQLNAGGGDDVLAIINNTPNVLVNGVPTPGATTYFTGAGSVFNGGDGVDGLSVGGVVDFQGTLISIEGIYLQPGFSSTSTTVASQAAAELTIRAQSLAGLTSNLALGGTGTIFVELDPGDSFNGSGYTFAANSHVVFDITGSDSADNIIGTSGDDVIDDEDGDDIITGGGGADVFELTRGQNVITDFTIGADRIDFRDLGITSFAMLQPYLSQVGSDARIGLIYDGIVHTLSLQGVSLADLNSASFIFAAGNDPKTDSGTENADTMFGLAGNDVLSGLGGDDVIFGGGGADQLLGGEGNDRLVLNAPIANGGIFNGGNGIDTLELRNWSTAYAGPNGPVTQASLFGSTLTSIERIDFASQSGTSITAQLLLGQANSGGLTQIVGGAGLDSLVLVALNGGTYTIPTLTRVNWSAPTISTPGDIVLLVASGPQNFTLNASIGHSGVEGLIGGAGNDVLNGSDGSEFLNGGGGVNQLHGGGGDDVLAIVNTTPNTLVGGVVTPGATTAFTGNGSIFDGGDGVDGLSIGGFVNFQGTLVSIEGIYLQPAFTSTNTTLGSQEEAFLQISSQAMASLPSNLTLGGTGTIFVNVSPGINFNGSAYVFAAGSDVNFDMRGSGGNDVIIATAGDDNLRGNGGNDTLVGGGGSDLMRGGAGVDSFDGGAEDPNSSTFGPGSFGDRISFFETGATQGVIADLRTGIISNDGFGNVETMTGIESLGGDTAFADQFYGNDSRNLLLGSAGDTLMGFGGDDVFQASGATALLDGGTGIDEVNLTSVGYLLPDANGDGVAENSPAMTDGWFVNLAGQSFFDGLGNAGTIRNVENVNGSDLNDTIYGNGLDNRIQGGAGDDSLRGNGGNDILIGGDGSDLMRGGAGVDSFDGGAEDPNSSTFGPGSFGDRISFFEIGATQGVIADLRTGIISNDGFGNVETMTGIESLGGDTAFADQFYGNDNRNLLLGSFGDTLMGFGGDDVFQASGATALLDGGTGIDEVNLTNSGYLLPDSNGDGVAENSPAMTDGWFVNLGSGLLIDGFGNSGSIVNVENVNGSDLSDTIMGNGLANRVNGGAGDDNLRGNGGNDILIGGDGSDLMRGGTGVDSFDGGAEDPNSTTFGAGSFGDRISFFEVGATQGVIADLRTGIISNDGFGNVETMSGIESLGGDTAFADQFYGNDSRNLLLGSIGDTLMGFGGDDVLQASGATALLDGGTGIDEVNLTSSGYLLADSNGDGIAENSPAMTDGWLVNLSSGLLIDGFGNSGSIINVENVNGTELDDRFIGNAADNRFDGGDGDDVAEFAGNRSDYVSATSGTGEVEISSAASGHDSFANVEVYRFADGDYAWDAGTNDLARINEGVVADGYLSGATVFIDANNNGKLDAGEDWAITDALGNYTLVSNSVGPLRAVGGTNVDTGLANTLTLSAPDRSGVINPLTTLIEALVEGGVDQAVAEAQVKEAFGLDPSLDLTNFDILAAPEGDAAALLAQKAAASIVVIIEAIVSVGGNADEAAAAGLSSLAEAVSAAAAGDGMLDLTDTDTLTDLITDALPDVPPSVIADLVTTTQEETEAIDTSTDIDDISDVQGNAAPILSGTQPLLPQGTEDVAYTVSAASLLAGFSDADGDTLSVAALAASAGIVTDNGDGTFRITPTANFNGSMTLSYNVIDGHGGLVVTSLSLGIAAVNDAPTAFNDIGSVVEDKSITGNVGTNDTDVDLDQLVVTSVAFASQGAAAGGALQGTYGTLVLNADGSYSYAADADYLDTIVAAGPLKDVFTYTVSDGHGGTSAATLTINVTLAADQRTIVGGNNVDIIHGDQNGVTGAEDTIFGGNSADQLYGEDGADILWGGNGDDRLFGGQGRDTLYGENGNDMLDGGLGNDRLEGGKGDDRLSGGAGADVFVFGKSGGSDIVTDFQRGVDHIQLIEDVTLKSSAFADVDHNGTMDLVLQFSSGSVTLLNLSTPPAPDLFI